MDTNDYNGLGGEITEDECCWPYDAKSQSN